MAEQVERFTRAAISVLLPIERNDSWVRQSDYEKLKGERDAYKRGQGLALDEKEEAEAERDQARKQALEEVAEELERRAKAATLVLGERYIDETYKAAAAHCREQATKEGEPEPLPDRVERLEAELVAAEAAVERKRQEDGP